MDDHARSRALTLIVVVVLAALAADPAGFALRASAPKKASARQVTGDAIRIPEEIPIFPLPETSLFPGVRRPFLIFEPRYREMIADALKGDLIIGMVRLRPGFENDYEGRPPIYSVGCAGVIDKYEKLPDGRYVILLRGLTTFRVASEDAPAGARKPYRLARIEVVPELLKAEERVTLSALRNRVEKQLDTLLPLDAEPPDPSIDDAEFINIVAQSFGMPESARQDLLERNSVVDRARALIELLERK